MDFFSLKVAGAYYVRAKIYNVERSSVCRDFCQTKLDGFVSSNDNVLIR